MSSTEEDSTFLATQRYAVVTGANKGIGLEICKQLASDGAIVVLTARDENKGREAIKHLKASAFSHHHNLFFHQLDVLDPSSISSLAHFVKNQYGKLDILVNNAGISGVMMDKNALTASSNSKQKGFINWREISIQPYNLAEECIQTNFYGAKRMVEAFLPLLHESDSARIVNVSSSSGKLKFVINEWATGILKDAENLSEDKIDEIFKVFLRDLKEGSLEAKNWPLYLSAYTLSKAVMNSYTRMLAKKYPNFMINSVCPGYVKTDINFFKGPLTVEQGAQSVVRLALLPENGVHSGLFFYRDEVSSP